MIISTRTIAPCVYRLPEGHKPRSPNIAVTLWHCGSNPEGFPRIQVTKCSRFDPQRTAADNSPVANLGANLWGHSEEGKTASIRAGYVHYKARCQSKHGCSQNAVIQIECRDSIGHPFWNRDFCESNAKAIIEKAERLKIAVSWPQRGPRR